MESITIDLTPDELEAARTLAAATFAKYRGRAGHYRNLERSHFLGKVGEIAVEKWLASENLRAEAVYADPARDADSDLVVSGEGIEVKTWRPATWDEWGRCVTPAQAPGIAQKSSAIVWTVADDEADPVVVEIKGWSTPDDVLATEVRATGPAYRQVANHQIEPGKIRPAADLLRRLREQDDAPN